MFIVEKSGYISIPNYKFHDSELLENMLSEFNELSFKKEYYGLSYDGETEELRIPSGFGVYRLEKILKEHCTHEVNETDFRSLNIELEVYPRDFIQEEIIEKFMKTKKSQFCINANTGIGKTYCAINCAVKLNMVTIIICHSSKLQNHWKEKILHYTNISPESIATIDSSAKMVKAIKEPNKYKIFVITHQTLNSFAKKQSWNYIEELFELFGAGLTIIDEVHRFFTNTVKILTHTNTRKYLLLTATFMQSSKKRNVVFQNCFENIPKWIQSDETSEKKQNHINGYLICFNSKPSKETQSSCELRKLFNNVLYTNYLVTKNKLFYIIYDKYLSYCMNAVKKFNGKGLIFCGSINACDILAERAKDMFTDFTIGKYHSQLKLNQQEKENILNISDVIFTTSKSLGEGADIKNLHYIIDIEAFRSKILCEQIPGRLRNLNDGYKFNYFKISDIGFFKVHQQINKCKYIWNNNFNSLKIRNL